MIIACIPAYNEERTIAPVVLKTMKHADKVIVCDDGSTDLTGEIARRMGAEVLTHEKNKGKGEALKTLFRRALESGADIIVTLDADLQHDPDEIPKLLAPLLRGEADVAIGSRFVAGAKTDMPSYRLLGTKIINWLSRRRINAPVKDVQSGYRAYTRRAAEIALEAEAKGYGIEQEQLSLVVRAGLKVVEVPVTIRYNGLSTSKRRPIAHGAELIANAIRLIVEERPLLLLGLPGLVILLAGVASAALLVWDFNTTRYFSIPLAITALGAFSIGLILVTTALNLYALLRLAEKVKRFPTP